LEPLAQSLALDIGHHEVGDGGAGAIVDHPRVEDRQDVGMLKPSRELDLAEKALDPFLAA
jgi:hypothetical protein